jgi:3',5'-cyclic AMP phosphodiesterase CpdA
MRTHVHLSDLHFGRIDAALLQPLTDRIRRIAPDLVVISGDLTQRARGAQFRQARAFLDSLPFARVVVPGNHDVPLHNLAARMLRPLAKYRRYISADLEPCFVDAEIAVLGVNSARSLAFKNGRINAVQLARVRERLLRLPARVTKAVVTHHPLDLPPGHSGRDLVGRARLAMTTFAACGVDLLLAGHLHLGHAGSTAARYEIDGHAAVVVQAGTATSTRGRGEANSFNVIRIERPEIEIERWIWDAAAGTFAASTPQRFGLSGRAWSGRPADEGREDV